MGQADAVKRGVGGKGGGVSPTLSGEDKISKEKPLDFLARGGCPRAPGWAGARRHESRRRHEAHAAPSRGSTDGRPAALRRAEQFWPRGAGRRAGVRVCAPRPRAAGVPLAASAGQPQRGAAGKEGGKVGAGWRAAANQRRRQGVVAAAAAVAAKRAAPHPGSSRVSCVGRRRGQPSWGGGATRRFAALLGAAGPLSAPVVAAAPGLHRY